MKRGIVKTHLHLAIQAILISTPIVTAGLTLSSAVYADAITQQYAIPANALSAVLKQFAIQSQLTLAYEPQNISKIQSSGLTGHYTIEQALQILLKPHQFKATKLTNGGYSIHKIESLNSATLNNQASTQSKEIFQLNPIIIKTANPNVQPSPITQQDPSATQLATMVMKAESTHQTKVGKSSQSLKEVPQSVSVMSRERLDQQGLKTLDDVMLQTTGVTREQLWLNNNYSARGLKIENIRYDGGGASSLQDRSNSADMAQYDSVELLRGADGLFGAGEAGGVINLTSKRPKAETEFVTTLSAASWNNYRGEFDATGSLNEDQTIQGRLVTVIQDQDFFYKPTHNRREMVYGALSFELLPETTLFTGASYQKDKTDAFNASLPRWEDGADLHLPRSTTMGAPWGWMERENISFFANLQHQINDDWKTQLNIRHNIGNDKINGAEMEGAVSYDTLQSQWWRYQDNTKFKETTLDLNLQGSFYLFGQKHDLILGLDHANNQKDYKQNWTYYADGNAIDRVAPPEWAYPPSDWNSIGETTNKKTGTYGSLRIRPIDHLALIIGGRYTLKDDNIFHNLKTNIETKKLQDKTFIPYYGIVYDLTDQTSLYASSAEIYKSQANYLNANNQPLDPITGTNYEVGIKSTLLNDQLNASFALYQIKKEGEGVRISGSRSSPCCYIDSGLYESKGFEVEFNGNITPDWNMSFGYTYNENANKRNTDQPFNTYTPKHLLKIWTNYRLNQLIEGLEVGGGVTAQSKNYINGSVQAFNPATQDFDGEYKQIEIIQPKYAIWSARMAYEINPYWNVAFNLNNILDKRYYSTIGQPGYGNFYGEPRSMMLTLKGKY